MNPFTGLALNPLVVLEASATFKASESFCFSSLIHAQPVIYPLPGVDRHVVSFETAQMANAPPLGRSV